MDTSDFTHSMISLGESCFKEDRSSRTGDQEGDDLTSSDDKRSMPVKLEGCNNIEEDDVGFCDLFSKCVDGYRRLLLALQTPKNFGHQDPSGVAPPLIGPKFLQRALDEFGRLKIWGYDFRVELPDQNRLSLGAKLQHHLDLRARLYKHLQVLDAEIQLGMRLATFHSIFIAVSLHDQ
jgi:hypothetical protein